MKHIRTITAKFWVVILIVGIATVIAACGKNVDSQSNAAGLVGGLINVPELPKPLIDSEMAMYSLAGKLKTSNNPNCANIASLIINTYLGRHRALGNSQYGDEQVNNLNWGFLQRTDQGLKMQGCPSMD